MFLGCGISRACARCWMLLLTEDLSYPDARTCAFAARRLEICLPDGCFVGRHQSNSFMAQRSEHGGDAGSIHLDQLVQCFFF